MPAPVPGAPGGNNWFAIAVTERGVVKATVLTAAQWQADQNPAGVDAPDYKNIGAPGGYPTRAAAQAAVTAFNQLSNSARLAQAGVTTAPNLPNPLSGIDAVGGFFSRLGQASTWIRVGEVVLGLVLIAIGLARITNAVPIATKVAKVAGTAAIL